MHVLRNSKFSTYFLITSAIVHKGIKHSCLLCKIFYNKIKICGNGGFLSLKLELISIKGGHRQRENNTLS